MSYAFITHLLSSQLLLPSFPKLRSVFTRHIHAEYGPRKNGNVQMDRWATATTMYLPCFYRSAGPQKVFGEHTILVQIGVDTRHAWAFNYHIVLKKMTLNNPWNNRVEDRLVCSSTNSFLLFLYLRFSIA